MKSVAGGFIAIALLAFYAYLIWLGCATVKCVTLSGCTSHTVADFNDVMSQALSVIGGLVSAFIIAELAVTKSGDAPASRALAANASPRAKSILKWVSGLYILVWLVSGAYAFLIGIEHPTALPVLTNVGQSWFGLAVAAAYAYFGLAPSQS